MEQIDGLAGMDILSFEGVEDAGSPFTLSDLSSAAQMPGPLGLRHTAGPGHSSADPRDNPDSSQARDSARGNSSGDDEQIDLGGLHMIEFEEPPRQKRRIERYSTAHVEKMITGIQLSAMRRKQEKTNRTKEHLQQTVDAVCTLLPEANQLIGSSASTTIGEKKEKS